MGNEGLKPLKGVEGKFGGRLGQMLDGSKQANRNRKKLNHSCMLLTRRPHDTMVIPKDWKIVALAVLLDSPVAASGLNLA